MPHIVFGSLDLIALPKLGNMAESVTPSVYYTDPTLDRYYSPYGFAFPLDDKGVPLDILLDNNLPLRHAAMEAFKTPHQFLLVDLEARLWKIIIMPDDDGKQTVTSLYIDHRQIGWWVTTEIKDGVIGADIQMVTGFLSTQPKIKDIDKFWYTYQQTRNLEWLSIKQIRKTLEEKFLDIPLNPQRK